MIKENSKHRDTQTHIDTYKIILMLPIEKYTKDFCVCRVPGGLGLKHTK